MANVRQLVPGRYVSREWDALLPDVPTGQAYFGDPHILNPTQRLPPYKPPHARQVMMTGRPSQKKRPEAPRSVSPEAVPSQTQAESEQGELPDIFQTAYGCTKI